MIPRYIKCTCSLNMCIHCIGESFPRIFLEILKCSFQEQYGHGPNNYLYVKELPESVNKTYIHKDESDFTEIKGHLSEN